MTDDKTTVMTTLHVVQPPEKFLLSKRHQQADMGGLGHLIH